MVNVPIFFILSSSNCIYFLLLVIQYVFNVPHLLFYSRRWTVGIVSSVALITSGEK